MVLRFGISTFTDTAHVRYCFYLTRSNFHHNGCSRFGIDLLQHIDQRLLGNILNIDIYRRTDIHTVHRFHLDDIRPTAAYATYGTQPGFSPKQRIVLQLQTVLSFGHTSGFDFTVDISDRTGSQCTERFLALYHFLCIESALVSAQTKERIFLHLFQVGIRSTTLIDGILTTFTFQSPKQMSLISGRSPVLEFPG